MIRIQTRFGASRVARSITPNDDNYGFAKFVSKNYDTIRTFLAKVVKDYKLECDVITLYGEWCGKGIQKNVAISQLDRMFVYFELRVTRGDDSFWLKQINELDSFEVNRIFNVYMFPRWTLNVSFENPALVQNRMIMLTNLVEKSCPVGRYFGVWGVGEGIVWCHYTADGQKYNFKVKGEKHTVSKVKTLAPVDTEKIKSVNEFVEYAVTENRLKQAIDNVFTQNNIIPAMTNINTFIKWIMDDIRKEESDTLADNNLELKDVGYKIVQKVKIWFHQYLSA